MGNVLEKMAHKLRGGERPPLKPMEMLARTGALGEIHSFAEELLSRGAIVRFGYDLAHGQWTLISESPEEADCVEVAWGISSKYNAWRDPLCGSTLTNHEISMMYGVKVVASAAGELTVDLKKPGSEGWISFEQYLEQTEGARDRLKEDYNFSRTKTRWVDEVRFVEKEVLSEAIERGPGERSLTGALP